MHPMMAELQTTLEEATRLHALSMRDDLPEEETDAHYDQYHAVARVAAGLIVKMAGIGIDEKTALRMVIHRRHEILGLLARAV